MIESSGNHHGLASAINGAVRGGTVVMVGLLPTGMQPVPISLAITRELQLLGSFRFNDEIDEVIAALADGSLHIEPVITHEYPLADALHAFEVAKDSTTSGKVLLSFGKPGMPSERASASLGSDGCVRLRKSTVGALLRQRLGMPFFDGDDFHPAANKQKMAAGVPLTDTDREPWLARLGELLAGRTTAARESRRLLPAPR